MDKKVVVELSFLMQLRWDLIALKEAYVKAKRGRATRMLERQINSLEWKIAAYTALAWVVFVISQDGRRRAIMPVSSTVSFQSQIAGMTCTIRYEGMEGRNGCAAIELPARKGHCRHFNLEIDGEEQDAGGMRARVFSKKEEAMAWI